MADDRVAVSAPSIGVQGWGWAVRNDSWQARLGSIPLVGPAAAADLGLAAPDARVVEALWRKLMPGGGLAADLCARRGPSFPASRLLGCSFASFCPASQPSCRAARWILLSSECAATLHCNAA